MTQFSLAPLSSSIGLKIKINGLNSRHGVITRSKSSGSTAQGVDPAPGRTDPAAGRAAIAWQAANGGKASNREGAN